MPPAQKPGKSVQEVGTPDEFIKAVEKRFGKIDVDLAGDSNLHVVDKWYGPGSTTAIDSLVHPWQHYKFGFLNPPFGKIAPWVEKCAYERTKGTKIIALLPMALETKWFTNYVYRQAHVLILKPRLKFKGHNHDFPKGLIVAHYDTLNYPKQSIEIWDWKKDMIY